MDLTYRPLSVPTARPFRISQGVEDAVHVVICEIAHDGVVGRGEASPSERVTGETETTVNAFLDWAAGEVKELEASGIPKFLAHVHDDICGNPSARAALDLALHDLAGKLSGQPVHRLFGLAPGEIDTTMTVSFDDPAAMAAEALDHWSRGFACIKLKLGDARRDLERLAAVRRAVPDATLRVDANTAWTFEEAFTLTRKMPEYGVEFVEQPLAVKDEEGLVALGRESPVPIYLDESAMDVEDVKRFAQKGFRGGFNFKLQKTGGLRPAFVALREARERAFGTQLGCNLETGLGITAAMHLVALLDHADLDGNVLLARDPFKGVRPRRGRLVTPTVPGLGAEPVAP